MVIQVLQTCLFSFLLRFVYAIEIDVRHESKEITWLTPDGMGTIYLHTIIGSRTAGDMKGDILLLHGKILVTFFFYNQK